MDDEGLNEGGSNNLAHLTLEDKGHSRGSKKGGGRGSGRGGGQPRDVQISRALSRLLRHQAENAGIQLDAEGYAPLDRVLAYGPLRSLGVTLQDIRSIVSTNDKQRFSMTPANPAVVDTASPSANAADYLIRANQGHSIKLESSSLMVTLTPEGGSIPARVLHGTYFAFWPEIVAAGGLKPMGRNHVHCSTGTPEEGVVSGMRRDAELLVEIDVERSIKEGGLKWWKSENEVVLTEGGDEGLVSSKFFKLVTGRNEDVGVLWQNGEKVTDLPEGLKIKAPQGKGRRGGGASGGRGRGPGKRGS